MSATGSAGAVRTLRRAFPEVPADGSCQSVALRPASAAAPARYSPRRSSADSVATTIDGPSIRKCRRAAALVSENPNPSAPSATIVAGHPGGDLVLHRALVVAGGDHRAGPAGQPSGDVRRCRIDPTGRAAWPARSASPSRRSSVQLVTDQTSAATSQSCASNCWASSAQRTPTPGGEQLRPWPCPRSRRPATAGTCP